MSGFGIRRRVLLVVVTAVGIAIAALVLAFNVVLARTLAHDSRDLARTRASAELALLDTEHGRLVVPESPDQALSDTYLWVFGNGTILEQPRTGSGVLAAAHALTTGPSRYFDVRGADLRLYAAPVISGGRRFGTVVTGVPLAPYQQTQRVALVASVVLGAFLLVVVALAAYWLLGAALRPVTRMTRQAAAWSEHDLDRRFALGDAQDELSELAATLDGLLDRVSASLRREQRFSAELSHELRTPLARVMAESELALRRDRTPEEYRHALEQITRNAGQLTRTVDALLAAARYEAGLGERTADAHDVAAGAVAACADLAFESGVEFELGAPVPPIRVAVDPDLGERILQPLFDNACRFAARIVSVSIDRVDGVVRYTVEDDGIGIAEESRERIFEPGVRSGEGARTNAGAGLGLALARRLARSAHGEIVAVARPGGGRFVITLPSA
jgi:signal transduction histidine kinase